MQINKTNNVIFLREFESNLISEAFVVLKENVKISNIPNASSSKNEKINIFNLCKILNHIFSLGMKDKYGKTDF